MTVCNSLFRTSWSFKISLHNGIHKWMHIRRPYELKFLKRLLTQYEAEGDAFLEPILTCDESWVHHYIPETKQSSMEWHSKNETTPVRQKVGCLWARFLPAFSGNRGVAYVEFLHKQRMINAANYCKLLDKVKAAYWSKVTSHSAVCCFFTTTLGPILPP